MHQPLCASPASEACRLVAEIDSCINAAFAPLPPSFQLHDLALRVERAGQLEVSSLRHRHSHTAGPVFRLSLSLLLSPSGVSLAGDLISCSVRLWPPL